MKNKLKLLGDIKCRCRKLIFVMKLTFLAFFLGLMGLSASTYSQKTKLSLDLINVSISEVLKNIESQSEFVFIYENDVVNFDKKVSIKANESSVNQILTEILDGTGTSFEIVGKQIIITKNLTANDLTILKPKSANESQQPQKKAISGIVKDSEGVSLPGVSVVVKGTTLGIITDAEGKFTLSVPNNANALVFSFIGMKTQEVNVVGKTSINIIMVEEITKIDEVVAVGYGIQKKVDLTGSVSSVSSGTLLERPVTDATNLLQGRISGLEVTQPTGQPGVDTGVMQIRGMGSFGASPAPLVLIDGVIGSLSNVAPGDIADISVLKDASSASIYGSRGANGVILVTTKKATKGTSIEYRMDVGTESATMLPELIYNSAEYMQMYNTAATRSGLPAMYTQSQINAYTNPTDKNQYPNFNWMKYSFRPATSQNYYLSLSGVSDKTSYKFSLNYLNEDGIITDANINFKRYNAQLNIENEVIKGIKIGTNIGLVYKNIMQPPGWTESSVLAIIQKGPDYGPTLPDGSGRLVSQAYPNEAHNTTAPTAFSNGSLVTQNYAANAQFYVKVDLLKGLVWLTKAAINYSDQFSKNYVYATHNHYYFQKFPGQSDYSIDPNVTSPGATGVTDNYTKSVLPTIYSTLTYTTKIAQAHNLNTLAGYEQQSNKTQYLIGNKNVFPDPALSELNAGGSTGQNVQGDASEYALRSYFGRVAYDYKSKYLLEANARYDGTSRVAPANRWGLFPSLSAGWKISEERFIKDRFSWINNMKLRASYGVLGNQEIGNYTYQNLLAIVQYPYGANETPGAQLQKLADKNLKWETTKVTDLGVDIDIYNRLLGITFDYFEKTTSDILAAVPVPLDLGVNGPITNNGKLQNKGWEMEIRHGNKIGQFSYDVNFLVSTYKNKVLAITTPTEGINVVGLPYGSYYLYQMAGIFQSVADINASPVQSIYHPLPGDIKIKDVNGNGVIDPKDRVSYSPYPKYTYSFGLNARWKSFSLDAFAQGVSGLKTLIYGWGFEPFVQGDPPRTIFRNAWSTSNPSNTIPAPYMGSGGLTGSDGANAYASTYFLQNGSYLRIKNVKLSYTLPKIVAYKIKANDINVYLSGDNLFTFTKFPATDPEARPASGNSSGRRAFNYPQVRIINVGLIVKF